MAALELLHRRKPRCASVSPESSTRVRIGSLLRTRVIRGESRRSGESASLLGPCAAFSLGQWHEEFGLTCCLVCRAVLIRTLKGGRTCARAQSGCGVRWSSGARARVNRRPGFGASGRQQLSAAVPRLGPGPAGARAPASAGFQAVRPTRSLPPCRSQMPALQWTRACVSRRRANPCRSTSAA